MNLKCKMCNETFSTLFRVEKIVCPHCEKEGIVISEQEYNSLIDRNKGLEGFEIKQTIGGGGLTSVGDAYGSIKAPNQNFHPTIKPVALMRYLVRMITPPNGIVLDPFNGSGTTGVACKVEGFNYVGIELDAEYCKISEARIEGWKAEIEMPETIQQNEVKKEIVEQETPKNQLNLF
jgi:DNA modification methylase